MNKLKKLNALLLFLVLASFTSDKLPPKFEDLLKRANMVFKVPTDLVETEIIKNSKMKYDYALKHPSKKFEVRYAIRPLDSLIIRHNKKNKKSRRNSINPNELYSSLIHAVVLNVSGKENFVIKFKKQDVKREFNANWGATKLLPVDKAFGQDYKLCTLIALHRKNYADAYIFYLYDDPEEAFELMMPLFHSLKFNAKE